MLFHLRVQFLEEPEIQGTGRCKQKISKKILEHSNSANSKVQEVQSSVTSSGDKTSSGIVSDEEIDKQKLEAHSSYMAKIQEVSPDESSSTDTPLEQVQIHDENDVFANVRRHSEQPESIKTHMFWRSMIGNVNPDSLNKCTNVIRTEECKTNLDEYSRLLGARLLAVGIVLDCTSDQQTELEKSDPLMTKRVTIKILQTIVNQKHDELVKKSLLTRSQFEGQLKEKTKVISDLKVKEGKDIDTMIEMDKQIGQNMVNSEGKETHRELQGKVVETQKKAKKSAQLQKDKEVNGKPSMINPARLPNTANGCKPKPRNWQASMSSRVSNKDVHLGEHRKQKPFLKFNDLQCPTCKKCLYSANHDECVLEYLSRLQNPSATAQNKDAKSHKTTKRYMPIEKSSASKKPERQIPTGHRFSHKKTTTVPEKTRTPRSCLRWQPTGRILKTVCLRWVPTGKLLNSCTGKVDNEPAHGSIVDIPHIHACKQSLGLSAGTSFNGQKQQRIDITADALYNEKQENLRVWLLKFLISKKPVPECSGLVLHQMTSDHNRSELGIQDHSNEPSSSKLVPKVVPLAVIESDITTRVGNTFPHQIAMRGQQTFNCFVKKKEEYDSEVIGGIGEEFNPRIQPDRGEDLPKIELHWTFTTMVLVMKSWYAFEGVEEEEEHVW
ncbi:hypothetical protein Tco_0882692 [Tanacetum coccineum]